MPGDDQDTDPAAVAAALAYRRGHGRAALPEPHDLAQAGPGDEDDGGGVGQQVVVGAVRAEAAAVRDHVGLGQSRQQAADRPPQWFQPRPLFRGGHPEQHVQAAAELLRMRPELGGLKVAAGGHAQAEQAAARVEPAPPSAGSQ